MNGLRPPRWYRQSKDNIFSWEIYGWNEFFLTLSIGSSEIQINKWPSSDFKKKED